jgi:hypothetical protein
MENSENVIDFAVFIVIFREIFLEHLQSTKEKEQQRGRGLSLPAVCRMFRRGSCEHGNFLNTLFLMFTAGWPPRVIPERRNWQIPK